MGGPSKRRTTAAAPQDDSPLELPQLSDQQQKLVDAQVKLLERAEIAVDAATIKIMQSVYQKRREAVKTLPRFWGTALAQHDQLAVYMAGPDDLKALTHLSDLWVEYDEVEPRAFTVNFEFSENPYFSDKVLRKEFKYTPPEGTPAPGTGLDANGVSDAQEAFEWESHVTPQAIKINWKDDAHNLTKLFPRVVNPEDPEDVEEFGSFFNLFEQAKDEERQDFYPQALQYYLGEGRAMVDTDEEMDSEDEDDNEDGDESEDLEEPRKKRARQG
ncbi:Nucleosome assembly protein (NAP) [Ceratobasidium sp. AG-Ba]|nr:Nucleosome assembly protein (NAP) [Ceratobasidium sp. AG-Ba]